MASRHIPTRLLWTSLFLATVLATGVGGIFADNIVLRDGRTISGSLLRQGSVVTITSNDGAVITVRPEDIAEVTLTGSVNKEEAATAEWTRAVLQIKKADDLGAIIAIHQKFLDKYFDVPLARDVRASLEVYQKLEATGGVKFRGRWVPKAQIEVMLKQWSEAARQAVVFYQAGHPSEALDAARIVIKADDQNPDAWTIAGLAAYRMNNLPMARDHFAGLSAADPTSMLAENNLAVISFQQKLQGEGIAHYVKAIQIMPDNRLLLDNIVEALNAYTGDKTSANYLSLKRQFNAAEIKMETTMAKSGQHRYGSTWVKQEELDSLKKNETAIQDKMARLDAQYKLMRTTLANLEAQIKQAAADYDNYLSILNNLSSQILLNQGQAVDSTAWIIQRDITMRNMDQISRQKTALEAQRDQLLVSSHDFPAQAEQLKADLTAARNHYSGGQQIMDWGDAENPPPPRSVSGEPGAVSGRFASIPSSSKTNSTDYEKVPPLQLERVPVYVPAQVQLPGLASIMTGYGVTVSNNGLAQPSIQYIFYNGQVARFTNGLPNTGFGR